MSSFDQSGRVSRLKSLVKCPCCGDLAEVFRTKLGNVVLGCHGISYANGEACGGEGMIVIPAVTLSQCQAKLDEILEMLEGR